MEKSEIFDSVEDCIADFAAGKIVIVADDESRENEGDMIVAAEKITPEAVNTMIRLARGLLCVPTTSGRLAELGIDDMVRLNRDIRSQRSIHFVVGGDYSFRAFGRPFKLTAEAYYKALSNLIPYNIDNVRISYYGRNMARGYATGLDMKLFGEFVPGTDSWISLSLMKTEEKVNGRWLPRPTDQRYRLSIYFTDYFPGSTKWQMSLRGTLAGGLPFGPPHSGREAALFRTTPYRRVDIGMSRCLIDNTDRPASDTRRRIRSLWLGVDVFNLLNINNVNSYYWVTDTHNNQFAVPNYLTGRQINVRLLLDF